MLLASRKFPLAAKEETGRGKKWQKLKSEKDIPSLLPREVPSLPGVGNLFPAKAIGYRARPNAFSGSTWPRGQTFPNLALYSDNISWKLVVYFFQGEVLWNDALPAERFLQTASYQKWKPFPALRNCKPVFPGKGKPPSCQQHPEIGCAFHVEGEGGGGGAGVEGEGGLVLQARRAIFSIYSAATLGVSPLFQSLCYKSPVRACFC